MRATTLVTFLLLVAVAHAQRRISRPDAEDPSTSPRVPGGRGRARFLKTPEFEKVVDDYEKASRDVHRKPVPRKPSAARVDGHAIDRRYEVSETYDDVPDSRRYTRPRVIHEDKFEAANAPSTTKLFEPLLSTERAALQELEDAGIKLDKPVKVELPQVLETTARENELSSTEVEGASTEAERELKKESPSSTTTTTTSTPGPTTERRSNVRGRTRGSSTTTEATRTRARARTRKPDVPELLEATSSRPFRVGRRRPPQDQESLKGRGPSVIESSEEQPATRARSGRTTTTNTARRTNSTRRAEAVRRGRGRRPEAPTTEAARSALVSRRKLAPREDPTSTSTSTTTSPPTTKSSRGRSKSRFNPTAAESTAVEVEAKPRNIPRTRGRSRSTHVVDELVASSTVDNPIRSLPEASTSRSVTITRRIETPKQVIKESVQSEVSEVISTRKVTRRKKVESTTKRKVDDVDDDLDELNYPPQFKAALLAKSKQAKPKKVLKEAAENVVHTTIEATTPTSSTTTSAPLSSSLSPSPSPLPSSSPQSFTAGPNESDNELVPRSTRPSRRRFSVSTKPPRKEASTKKPWSPTPDSIYDVLQPTRKPIAARSTVKPEIVSVVTLITRKPLATARSTDATPNFGPTPTKPVFHARFRESDSTTASVVAKKLASSKPSRVPYVARKNFKNTKVDERKGGRGGKAFDTFVTPAQVQQVAAAPNKVNRYSSRYRSELRAQTPVRASTYTPVYVPTVPTVTQSSQVKPQVYTEENDGYQIISIDDPVNSLHSDNLVSDSQTGGGDQGDQSKSTVSIIERIINSITSISTTAKPEVENSTQKTESTAILKIATKRPRVTTEADLSLNQVSDPITSEKPTTIIERILNSLSAIQATDHVGTTHAPVTPSTTTKKYEESRLYVSAYTSRPDDNEVLSRVYSTQPVRKTTPASTVAISLAEYLASLGHVSSTTVGTTEEVSTLSNEILDVTSFPSESLVTTTTTAPFPLLSRIFGLNVFSAAPSIFDPPSTTTSYESTTGAPITNPQPSTTTSDVSIFRSSIDDTSTETFSPTTTSQSGPNDLAPTTTDAPVSKVPSPAITDAKPTSNDLPPVTTDAPVSKVPSSATTDAKPTFNDLTSITTEAPMVTDRATASSNAGSPTTTNEPVATDGPTPKPTSNDLSSDDDPAPITTAVTTAPNDTDNILLKSIDPAPITTTETSTTTTPTMTSTVTPPTTTSTDTTQPPPNAATTEPPATTPQAFHVSLTSVKVTSPNEANQAAGDEDRSAIPITTKQPPLTKTPNRSAKLLLPNDKAVTTTPRSRDYFIFAVLPNNTVVRKRPPKAIEAPYLIVGVYPNNTIVQKFPNGTLVPEEPVVQDAKNVVEIDANQLSLDVDDGGTTLRPRDMTIRVPTTTQTTALPSSTTAMPSTTTAMPSTTTSMTTTTTSMPTTTTKLPTTTTAMPTTTNMPTTTPSPTTTTTIVPLPSDENLNSLTELLGGKTVEQFKNIVNQSGDSDATVEQLRNKEDDKENEIGGGTTKTRLTSTPTTTPITTTTRATTTRATTTRAITTRRVPTSTQYTTTDIGSFLASFLSTLRPVYTPTTTEHPLVGVGTTYVPVRVKPTTILNNYIDDTTTAPPTVAITARRRTTTTTLPTTTRKVTTTTRRVTTTTPSVTTTTPRVTTINPVTTTRRVTTTINPTTTFNPADVDIEELVKRSNKKLSKEQLRELEEIKKLEREQAALLEQLAFLTNLNIGQTTNPPPQVSNGGSNSLANRILAFAMERNKDAPSTTTTADLGITIVHADPVTTKKPPRVAVLDDKGTTLDDIIKELNDNRGNSVADSNHGKSQEAIIAAILKERGIEPSTPKALKNVFDPPTTRKPKTTTQRPPGRLMQGLNWILNALAPPPTRPRPRPRPKTTTRRPTTVTDFEELIHEPTELQSTFQSTRSAKQSSLSEDEVQNLIAQLEAIQKDPSKVSNLDLTPIKKLQSTTPKSRRRPNPEVEIISTGTTGSTRAPRVQETTRARQTTPSYNVEDEFEEVVTRARPRPTRGRVTLPPVVLDPVPGVNEDGPAIGGSFLSAAVNVTRAISTFLGTAIQGAAQSFQSMIGSGSGSGGSRGFFSSASRYF